MHDGTTCPNAETPFGEWTEFVWTKKPARLSSVAVIKERPKSQIEKRKRNFKFFSPVSKEE